MRVRTSEELRQARKEAGLNMKNAADFARVPYRTWQNWESEKTIARRPPDMVFLVLELYQMLKEHGLLPKEADDERKAA
jgi:DNA-binding XRE family transcriptional regulator